MNLLLVFNYEHPVLISVLNPNVHTSFWPSALLNRFSKETAKKTQHLNLFELIVSNSTYKSMNVDLPFVQRLDSSKHTVAQIVTLVSSCQVSCKSPERK
jgi:hypothetical protein